MNDFTKGEFTRDKYGNIRCDNSKGVEGSLQLGGVSMPMYDNEEIEANTHLVFTAFTTATKLADQGYDAVKVLEVLPEIMQVMADLAIYKEGSKKGDKAFEKYHAIIEQCRGES